MKDPAPTSSAFRPQTFEPSVNVFDAFSYPDVGMQMVYGLDVQTVNARFVASGLAPTDPAGVPEPGTYALMGTGLMTLGLLRRRLASVVRTDCAQL